MWLCTKLGFYSIVLKTPGEVHIRARCKKDLENLKHHCTARVRGASVWKIYRTEPADYRYRIVIRSDSMPELMLALADTLDYSNFKGVIASTPDQREKLGIYSAFHYDLEYQQNRREKMPPV